MFNVVLVDGMSCPSGAINWMNGEEIPHGWEGRIVVIIRNEEVERFRKDSLVSPDCDIVPCQSNEDAISAAEDIIGELKEFKGVKAILISFTDSEEAELSTSESTSWLSNIATLLDNMKKSTESLITEAPRSLKQLLRSSSSSRNISTIRRKQIPSATPGIVTQCCRCGMSLWNDPDRAAHDLALQQCPTCSKEFCSRRALIAHEKQYHPTCTDNGCNCGETFQGISKLNKHLVEFKKPVQCMSCLKRFSTARSANRHPCSDPLVVLVRTGVSDESMLSICRACGVMYDTFHPMCTEGGTVPTTRDQVTRPTVTIESMSSEYTSGSSITATSYRANVGRNPPRGTR